MSFRPAALRTPILIAALPALLAGAAACGKSSEKPHPGTGSGSSAVPTAPTTPTAPPTPASPPDPRSQGIIATSRELRDRACACTDAACALTVRKDHDRWLYEQVAEIEKSGPPKSTPADEQQASEAQRALFACLQRYGADENTADTQPPDVQLAPPIDAATAPPTATP